MLAPLWDATIMAARSSGCMKEGGGGGPRGEEALGTLQILGLPELVVDDAVHVAVVLAEVACRVL